MDHLPLPRNPSPTPSRVPLVCDKHSPYDDGDFATYPQRVNWPELISTSHNAPLWLSSSTEVITEGQLQKQEVVLQSWLFFGQLHAILAPFDLYRAEDYIDFEQPDRCWLHTRGVKSTVSQWLQAVRSLGEMKQPFIDNAKRNYAISGETFILLNNERYAKFNRMIKLSIFAIRSLVEGMIIRAIDGSVYSLTPHVSMAMDSGMRRNMMQNGWCPHDITMVEYQHASELSGRWHLEHMSTRDSPDVHASCSSKRCQHMQINISDYQPQHITHDCSCKSVGPSHSDIMACLSENDIPVLEIIDEQNLELRVHGLRALPEDTSYVALSHIWADGLGNPIENSLPSCQVRRLAKLISKIPEHRTSYEMGPASEPFLHKTKFFLWCDSLCCPLDPGGKALALSSMRDVYLNAAFVLVLDKAVESYRFSEIGILESGWRLLTSRYMRRLWTYQEAGLAPKLLIQFADAPVDILRIFKPIAKLSDDNLWVERSYYHVIAGLSNLRNWRRSDLQQWLKQAVMGLAHREVSVSSDEGLCIATVLGLDSQAMASAKPEHRMQVLWQLVAQHELGVSGGVIFNGLPRLDVPSFRWAPSTILQPIAQQLEFMEQDDHTPKAALTKRGLRVQCAGWRIRRAQLPDLTEEFWPEDLRYRALTHVRSGNHHYNIIQAPMQGLATPETNLLGLLSDRTREWYILVHKGEYEFTWERWTSQRKGLLVSMDADEYGSTYHHSHMLVYVDRLEPRYELPRQVDHIWAGLIRGSWTVTILKLLTSTERLLPMAFPWVYKPFADALSSMTSPILFWTGQELGRRIRLMMTRTRFDAPKVRAVATILHAQSEAVKNKVGSSIITAVMGRFVEVEKTFDASTEWIVD